MNTCATTCFVRWAATVAAVCGGLGGCTFAGRIASDPVKYNQSLADGNNRLLLLNIARASKKHPLYFSEVSEVNESLKGIAGLTADLPLTSDLDGNVLHPSLSLEGDPDFKVSPLNTKEFFSGITTPVSPATFAYYWDQGWPRQLLLLLLVREVTITNVKGPDGKALAPLHLVGRFDFFGDHPTAEYELYRAVIEGLSREDMKLDHLPAGDPIGPMITPDPAHPDTIRALMEADKAGYSVDDQGGGKFALHGVPDDAIEFGNIAITRASLTDAVAAVRGRIDEQSRASLAAGHAVAADARLAGLMDGLGRLSQAEEGNEKPRPKVTVRTGRFGPKRKNGVEKDLTIELFLRSPEAIIYHLGELVRAQRKLDYTVWLHHSGGREVPLFSACGGGCCGVSVEYCGERFAVGGDPDTDESMHVLSFLNQLLMLQKSSADLPKSTSVHVIGGR